MTKLGPEECLLGCCLPRGDTHWVAGTLLSEPANTHLLNVSDPKLLVALFVFRTYMKWTVANDWPGKSRRTPGIHLDTYPLQVP